MIRVTECTYRLVEARVSDGGLRQCAGVASPNSDVKQVASRPIADHCGMTLAQLRRRACGGGGEPVGLVSGPTRTNGDD